MNPVVSLLPAGAGAGGARAPAQWCWKGPLSCLSVKTLLLLPSKGQATQDTEVHTPGLVETCWHLSGKAEF